MSFNNKRHANKKVVCATCQSEFEAIFEPALGQAYGCASTVFGPEDSRQLVGYYGSTIADGNVYDVLTKELKSGIVCDDCIGRNKDGLKLVAEGRYFNVEL